MATQRRTILFSGNVQGVGFRYTTVQLARSLPLAGTIRNTEANAVELIVEGDAKSIDTLIALLREHFEGLIRNIQQTSSAPQGDLPPGIRITY